MAEPLPFVAMHEDDFEDLCCDLLQKEPSITTAERFGVRGQRQDGIDIRAYRSDGGAEVAQSKRYSTFTRANLRSAAEIFLASRDIWENWDVRRFVVCVACDVRNRRVQDEHQTLREQFQREGLNFELWGDTILANKLRGDRTLAEKYFSGEPLRRLCGSAFTSDAAQLSPIEAARSQLTFSEECGVEFEGEAEHELSEIRELARSGQPRTAVARVQRLRASPRWNLLRARTRAQLLRLAASLSLDCDRDLDAAGRDLKQARELDERLNYQIVDAAVALYRTNARDALSVLGQPLEIDAFNIKLALLELTGAAQEILDEVDKAPFEPNAGTYRLASIAAVSVRDLATAERFAAKALALAPTWHLVRLQTAKIDYLHCILQDFPMWHQLHWPVPVDAQYVKTDSASLARFDKAEAEFANLLEAELEPDDKRAIQAWRLACLSNNPKRRSEAEAYAGRLLSDNPRHITAVIWAMHKGFEFDRNAFFAVVRDPVAWAQVLPGDIQPVVVLLAQNKEFREAIDILDATKETFEQQNVAFVWRLLRAQFAALLGDSSTCSGLLANEPNPEHYRRLKLAIMRVEANRTQRYEQLADFLWESYRETTDPAFLFEACDTWLHSGKPQRIVEHHKELLRFYPTVTALRLAVQATFDAGEFKLCTGLLREYRPLFPDAELPTVLRRVEVECLRQIGDLTAAASLAESLAARHTDTETLVTLFQTQISLGDLRAGASTARQMIDRSDIAPAGLLEVARVIQAEDPGLAIKLWEEAIRRGVDDDPPTLMLAVSLGFRLGLEDRVGPLMPKFYALSQQPGAPVVAYTLDDTRALFDQMQQARADIVKLHGQGAIPLHLLTAKMNIPVTVLLCEQGRLNTDTQHPLLGSPLLIRAGSKGSASIRLRKPRKLFVDISSLLMADYLGVLEPLEQAFGPLLVSAHIQEFLREEIEKTLPHQPSRDAHRETLLKIIDQQRIAICSLLQLSRDDNLPVHQATHLLLKYARREKGVLCEFALPERSHPDSLLSAEDAPFFVTCSDLARAMRRQGIISETEFQSAVVRMLPDMSPSQAFKITPDSKIVLGFGVAEHLLEAGLLEGLLTMSKVVMSQEERDNLQAESRGHQLRLRTIERLKSFQDRVHSGLRDGTYKPVRAPRKKIKAIKNTAMTEGAAELCLWDLLSAKDTGARVVCADDRFLSRYTAIGKLPSIGILEVLHYLRQEKLIQDDKYFRMILSLREANARYLPVSAEEVLYQLSRTTISGIRIKETPALITLRGYIAGCCLDKDRLQPPFVADKKQFLGEFKWVMETIASMAEVISTLWADDSKDDATKEVYADWVLQNLFVPYIAVFDARGTPQADDGLETYAVTIGLLLAAGFRLPSPWSKEQDALPTSRQKFNRWIETRLLSHMQQVEPRLLTRLAKIEARSLSGLRRGVKTHVPEPIVRALIGKALTDLPLVLQSRLPLTGAFKRWVRLIEPREMMEINGQAFDSEEVHNAMASACNGKGATFSSSNGEKLFNFQPRSDSLPADRLYICGPGLPDKATVRETRLPALFGSRKERASFLASKTAWFDLGRERMKSAIENILRAKTAASTFARIEAVRESSGERFYRSLSRRLERKEAVAIDEMLPPGVQALVDHLRLFDETFSVKNVCFEACSVRLIAEIGLGPALERFATLPVLLPAPFWKSIRALSQEAFTKVMDVARARLLNPVSRIHLFHILAEGASRTPHLLDNAKREQNDMLSEDAGRERWETFAQLLDWSNRMFLFHADSRDLDVATRLTVTWLHAGRLFDALFGHGIDNKQLRAIVRSVTESVGPDLAAYDKVSWFDAAHPRHIARLPLLLRGLGSAIATLPPDIAASLRLAKLPWEQSPPASAALLLRDTSLAGNVMGSWLGGDARTPLEATFTNEIVAEIQPMPPAEVIERALNELDDAPEDVSRWHVMHLLIGDFPIREKGVSVLNELIGKTDFAKLNNKKGDQDHLALLFACSRAASLSAETRAHLENHVFKLVDIYRKLSPSDAELRARSGLAVTCLVQLAMQVTDERELYRRYHELLTKLVWAWPETARLVKDRFCGWPPVHPLTRGRGKWELDLTIRTFK